MSIAGNDGPNPKGPENKKIPPTPEAGILKDEDRRREKESLLRRIEEGASVMTRADLERLRSLVATTHSIEELRDTLARPEVREEFSPEHHAEILRIINEIRELSGSDLERLKLEIAKVATVHKGKHYTIDENVYASRRFAWVRDLEESEWGDSVLKDLAGLAVGVGDSAYAVLKLLVDLLVDLVRLPVDVATMIKNKS